MGQYSVRCGVSFDSYYSVRCGVWYGLVQCGVVRLRQVSTHTLSCAQHLAPWLGSSDGTERERGSALLVDLMDAYQTQHATMEGEPLLY